MATFLNYPFDAELFSYEWQNYKDLTTENMLKSGAVVNDSKIAGLINNGSDFYTVPFYAPFAGTPVNYDGQTNIDTISPTGESASGIVFGRAKGFKAVDFIGDYNSGADPMAQIVARVAKYWQIQEQAELLGIVKAVFGINTDADWLLHTTDIATTGATVADSNKIAETTLGDAAQKACGDFADQFTMAIMHSKVANRLAGLKLLEYLKYTDANGIERQLRMGMVNGLTVVVDDGVPVAASESAAGEFEYTTYMFGAGAIRRAEAPVAHPSSVSRDESTNGGEETLWTRKRMTLHPNGFSFTKPGGYTSSPTRAQLGLTANWDIVMDAKLIPMAQIVTNG